jgi:hypothetical protein
MGIPDHHRVVDSNPTDGRSRRVGATQSTNLAELLERVLDKGIVIAGDITVSLGEIDLLNIKVRLLVASIDKAQEIGINWWQSDPALSSHARKLEDENRMLKERLERLEQRLIPPAPSENRQKTIDESPQVARQDDQPTA